MTKEEKRKIRKLKRKASRNRNKRNRRKTKLEKIKVRKGTKVSKIKAKKGGKAAIIKQRKSAKINRQDERTARTNSRSSRKLERQETKQDKITAKYLSGGYTPEAIEARMSGYGDIAGSVAEGAVEGAMGGGSILDLLGGSKDEDGDIISGSGSSNLQKYLLIGGAVVVGYVILTSGNRRAA